MKKIISMILAVLVSVSTMSMFGCSNETKIDKTKTQLYVSNYDAGIGRTWIEAIAKSFEEDFANYSFESGRTGVQVILNHNRTDTGAQLLANIGASDDNVFFTESIDYPAFANGQALDITSIVKDGAITGVDANGEFTRESVTIESKLDSNFKSYLNRGTSTNEKYYGLPYYLSISGFLYDGDLWNEKYYYCGKGYAPSEIVVDVLEKNGTDQELQAAIDLYIASESQISKEIFCVNHDGKDKQGNAVGLSAGPDGLYGTYDDGMPATFEEFYTLMDKMVADGISIAYDKYLDSGFRLLTKNDVLYIAGSRNILRRGTMYAAQEFLKYTIGFKAYAVDEVHYDIRNILGINNSPAIFVKDRLPFRKQTFNDLNLKFVRHHDAVFENPGLNVVDVSRMFPLFHLNETKKENYFFSHTDDYFNEIKDFNGEIEFRIGETIDHSGYGRLIDVPKDVQKWARICRNIIAHYKIGKFNGLNLNLTRVCVWEEPDNKKLFSGDVNDYFNMFSALYKLLRKDFPDLKIGGPTVASASKEYVREFLKLCRENDICPDFLSCTIYLRDLEEAVDTIKEMEEYLSEFGFNDTKISISEWHMAPKSWEMTDGDYTEGLGNWESAAFSTSLLIRLNELSKVDSAYYYAFNIGAWSVIDDNETMPVYYGLYFFQKWATECSERLEVLWNKEKDVEVVGGKTKDGIIRVLISCFDSESYSFKLDLGVDKVKLYSINSDSKPKNYIDGVVLTTNDGTITFDHFGGGGVYMIEF